MIKKLSIKSFIFLSVFSGVLTADSYKFGVGSCLDQDFPQPIWNQIEEEDLNYFIFLGDNVYGDVPSGSLWKLPRAYKKQKKLFPDFLSEIEKFAIWDDHDYGKNDGGSEYRHKEKAQRLFLDFWQIPKDDVRQSREGIYFSKDANFFDKTFKLIFLDTRYFRSNLTTINGDYVQNKNPDATILGYDQWQWLEQELNKDFDFLIIFSSIQILAEDHEYEKWSNFPLERDKLLNLINNYKDYTLLFSGDRHRAGIYKKNNLFEITASSMNKPGSSFVETDKYLIGETYPQENFVFMEVFEKTIYVGIKDIYGNTLNSISVNY